VLFVHGIGEQPRGDTLLAFGEPLIRCIRAWVDGRKIGKAAVIESKLSASQSGSQEPSHAVLEITVGQSSPQTWLLAESWWADEFHRPPFMKLAGWLLAIGPWALISHASRWLRDAPSWWQVAYQLLKIVFAVPLSLLLQIVVASLALLAWLPIPVLRRSISGFLLNITGTLGDSYVLLENPVQQAAAIDALRHNVDWLAGSCERIAVVAHSQGAAIAQLALAEAERRHPKVCVLATFGSGVAKLSELRSMSTEKLARLVRTIVPVSTVAIALLPQALSVAPPSDDQSLIWFLFLVIPLVMMTVAVAVVWNNLTAWPERAANLSLWPLDWIDYWATSDPVPNGPFAPEGTVPGLQQVRITNRISWFTDHTTYWENRDEFVMPLASELDRRACTGIFPIKELAPITRIPGRRVRANVLVAARAICALAALVILAAFRGQLALFGSAVLQSLSKSPLTKPVSELVMGVGSLVGLVIRPLFGLDAASIDQLDYAVVGALFPLAMLATWYRFCVVPLWENWNAQCFGWLCQPATIPPHPVDRAQRPLLLSAVVMVLLLLAVRAVFQPDAQQLLIEGVNVLITAPIIIMAIVVAVTAVVLIYQIASLVWEQMRRFFAAPQPAIDPKAPVKSVSEPEKAVSDKTLPT